MLGGVSTLYDAQKTLVEGLSKLRNEYPSVIGVGALYLEKVLNLRNIYIHLLFILQH